MFCNKYVPKSPEESFFNQDEINKIINMSKDDAIPHLIVYGPEGSGKKTCINFFLESLYGPNIHKLVTVPYSFIGSGNITQTVEVLQSDYHIIIEPNSVNSDRYLIQEVVKEYAKRVPIGIIAAKKTFKTIFINNIDNMSYYAQTSLRRTIELYSHCCRFIMWSRSLSKVITPLLSRCYCFRIKAPTDRLLMEYIFDISIKENINLKLDDISRILYKANGNIKISLWLLELKYHSLNLNTTYDNVIKSICDNIFSDDINSLNVIRASIYNIMITNINCTKIIKDLLNKLITSNKIALKQIINITKIASNMEYNLISGRHEIFHLESFINSVKNILSKN